MSDDVPGYISIVTKACMYCGQQGHLTLWSDDVARYRAGAHVQDAFPDLMAPAREQIITGTHPACWAKIFKDYEDEE